MVAAGCTHDFDAFSPLEAPPSIDAQDAREDEVPSDAGAERDEAADVVASPPDASE